MRGKTQLESGLRWARFSFTEFVKDRRAIFIVPKEWEPGSTPPWMIEKGVFTREELLGLMDLAHQKKKGERIIIRHRTETHSVGVQSKGMKRGGARSE